MSGKRWCLDPGPAQLREQVGLGLAWGSAILHKWLQGVRTGGWLGTTPGWDMAPVLGVPSHNQLQAGAGQGSFPEAMD